MASAPEKINIKRRRDDDVIDVLTLAGSKKQRTSDHFFVRLGSEQVLSSKPHDSGLSAASNIVAQSTKQPPGVPTVGTTLPGDEINDFKKYRAALDQRDGSSRSTLFTELNKLTKPPPSARRFHLTRDLSLTLRPQHSGGIRKSKSLVRPHLPTFVEKLENLKFEDLVAHAEPPIDRVIKSVDGVNHKLDLERILSHDGSVTKEKTATFQKANSSLPKTGQSIRDDPATWDLTSDQLADELMLLALEMDPDAKAVYQSDPKVSHDTVSQTWDPDRMLMNGSDDYVYETYVRVQQKGVQNLASLAQLDQLGYLIIDEEEEDLWEQYLHDDEDDDDDWDEEDGDSNAEDNPRNDYPEDEVSSDDEYGRNIYQYRRDHSDDEQFDQEDV